MAGFDPTRPGLLVLYTQGNPTLEIAADPKHGSLVTELSFRRKVGKPEVLVDLDSVLQTAVAKVEKVSYDLRRKSLRLTTENSELFIVFPDPAQEEVAPVRSLVVKSKSGAVIAISNIRVGGERSSALGHDKAEFDKLGVPTRVLGEKEAPTVPLFVPPTFGRDQREQQGIEKVRTLFPSLPKPTAPATRPVNEVRAATEPLIDGKSSHYRLEEVDLAPVTQVLTERSFA